MPMKKMYRGRELVFEIGFEHKGRHYAWYEGYLYRLPFESHGRIYTIKRLQPQKRLKDGAMGFYVNSEFQSLRSLSKITKRIRFFGDVPYYDHKDFPTDMRVYDVKVGPDQKRNAKLREEIKKENS